MRVFLAGATGVLGRALIPQLLQRGDTVCALVRDSSRTTSPSGVGVEVVAGDLLAPEMVSRLPTLVTGSDAVVHAATAIPRDASAPGAWETNTRLRSEGVRALLDAALASHVACYIQQSIVMAYPDGGDIWLDETTPLDTSRKTVIAMEAMVRAIPPERLRWSILRGGSFVGPATAQDALIARLRAGEEAIPGDGGNYLSLIHAADMAAAIVAALHAAPAGSTFNINDIPLRQGEYEDHLAELVGAPAPRRDTLRPRPSSFRCDATAARTILGWSPSHSIWPLEAAR
jgi:nucleoside-diphosphate-sugar epimerase